MAAPFKVKALYEYSSPHEDDLNFGIGQIITVTDEEDDDWYGGEYLDDHGVKQEGIFPRNFVEKFEPTAPPRPTRTRHKKEPEAAQPAEDIAAPPPPPPAQQAPPPAPVPEPEPEIEEVHEPVHKSASPEPPAPAVPEPAPPKPVEPVSAPAPPPAAPKVTEPPAPAPVPAPAPAAAAPPPKPKPGPPPVSEKPKSSSFKDRIAAFNKPAAPPIAPFKPSGLGGSGSGFVRKPFVAPPPSRHAYVPPPQQTPTAKVYRRDEDPEIKEREAETQGQAERAGLVPSESQEGGNEDQPKPTSLKERIALLQKQQMEQAQRHADAAAKKEKPKKPQKKRESIGHAEALGEAEEAPQQPPVPLERRDTEDSGVRTSTDEPRPTRMPPAPRRKSSKGPAEPIHDGNEADMSGAGDTTEGNDDLTERDDSDGVSRRASRAPTLPVLTGPPPEAPKKEESDNEEEEEEEEEDVDPEVKRKEELRARMAKMSGGMGFHGMFGAPMPAPAPPPKKKKAPKPERTSIDEGVEEASPVSYAAPPIPTMMALPGMGGPRKSEELTRPEEEPEPAARAPPPPVPSLPPRVEEKEDDTDEEGETTPAPPSAPTIPPRDPAGPPPIPGGRPAPPPVPSDARPPPPPPPSDLKSQTEGSESGDELSGGGRESEREMPALTARSPPMPPIPAQPPVLPVRSPSISHDPEEFSPASPSSTANKRLSRPPPPIPGSAPALPSQSRPPPPPPPGALRRQSTQDTQTPTPTRPPQAGEEGDEEVTEYEGDYDTDIASSVPHKDALKAHARDSSLEDNTLQSPVAEAPSNVPPPIPSAAAPRAIPPPVPSQPPPENKRRSVDVPRAAPPPPPPTHIVPPQPPPHEEEYDPYNYSGTPGGHAYAPRTPKIEEEAIFPGSPSVSSPIDRRAPPPSIPSGRVSGRASLDVSRAGAGVRRSMDLHRPSMSMESGFIANDIDLAIQSGWWKQANQVPPVLQGRKDIFFESEESTSTNGGQKTTITREIFILYQDYSQTFLTIRYDPYDPSDVELDQRQEPPPRPLRQDQMEEFYERFGRPISEAVAAKKDSVVADGTPQGLVLELLKPYKDHLPPVGTRAYGALVYSNMANASTQQNDVIRPGDILTIRNARFQGKHGPMHAKYSVEVGKPDHVAIVAEWDGTKKKVRAWEQGRESKKVKVESFKLDDLRSGEVKIWRVMPRSWVGWSSQP
ncbi:assembly of actin patch protein [Fusarium solani]|nr:assembly of actin patch protein [Fusarium solani]